VTEEEQYLFDLQGYLVLENVLKPQEVQELNTLLDKYDFWNQEKRGHDSPLDYHVEDEHFFHVSPPHTWEKPFPQILTHPLVVDHLRNLVGTQFRYDHGQVLFMRKGSGVMGLHNGGTPWEPLNSYNVKDGVIHTGLTVVSYAITDQGGEHGGFCAIPGSHKSNFVCPPAFESLEARGPWLDRLHLKAGSAVIFTEAVSHGTLPWLADHERRSLMYRYTPGYMAFIGRYRQDGREEDLEAYPSRSDIAEDDLSPELSRMLEPPYLWERSDTIG
jgi:hypothetical protein